MHSPLLVAGANTFPAGRERDREAVEGGRLKGGTIKLRRSRHHNPRPERPSNLRTLRTFGAKPRQPSRRRRVQRRSHHHNPRPEGPSNLRTLRPMGPVHLKNPFPQPFYTTCRRQAATTLGAQPRQPSHRRCVQRPRAFPSRPKGTALFRTLQILYYNKHII